jgi:hypothetical protein
MPAERGPSKRLRTHVWGDAYLIGDDAHPLDPDVQAAILLRRAEKDLADLEVYRCAPLSALASVRRRRAELVFRLGQRRLR